MNGAELTNELIKCIERKTKHRVPVVGKWLRDTGLGIETARLCAITGMINAEEYDLLLIRERMNESGICLNLRVPMIGNVLLNKDDVEQICTKK